MRTKSFANLAAWCAFIAGAAGLLYAVSFIILQNAMLSALFLLIGGVASLVVWTGLYEHFRDAQPPYALLAFLFTAAAAAGSAIHGGYDLSNALHPPANPNTDLPSAIDPRGLLTFGIAALGLFFFSWLASRDKRFPRYLAWLGYVSAALMLILYLARLLILQPTSPVIAIPALLEGFIVNPVWLVWLGIVFLDMGR